MTAHGIFNSIRATKREIEAQNAIGGDTAQLKAKLRQQEKDYRAFSKDVGIRPKENRLKVISGSSNIKSTKVYKDGEKYGTLKENRLYRARKINSYSDLEKLTQSNVLKCETYEEIQRYFEEKHGVNIVGFENKALLDIKAIFAGYDDIMCELPNSIFKIRKIQYNSKSKYCGTLNNHGLYQIGPSGLKDYGTGVHEAMHAYDLFMSKPNTHSFAEEVVEQARKNLKLRKNSKKYINLAFQITGSLEDIGKSYEMLAYGIETAKGGINNKLAHEMYRIVKEQK